MARDPLATLARLRRVETEAARRRLGQAVGRAQDAAQREAETSQAIILERALHPTAYAAWLPRGLATRDRAAVGRRIAEAGLEEARIALGGTRAAERAVEALRERRAEDVQRRLLRREQAKLDEAAARRLTPA